MTLNQLWADCLDTGISSGTNSHSETWFDTALTLLVGSFDL